MIHDLPPYPEYKDSGVPLLGDVPEHWDVRRQRNAANMLVSNIDKITVEDEIPVRLCNYVDVYKNDRITGSLSFMRATATADEVERFRLRTGDVLITKDSESWTDIGVPALVEYTAPDLVCGYHLAILRPREGVLEGGYLLRALQSQGVAVQFRISANGVTRYGLSHDAIKGVLLPLPPLTEQAAIVGFLDHADRRIRRYIAAKKKLIALLNEQKQAVVHHAVTRGLDGNVRVEPSGVDWLGDIPERWDLRRLRFLADIDTGSRDTVDRKDDGEYPFYVRSQVVERIDSYAFDGEAVLTAGDGAGVAKVFHYIDGKFDYHQRVYRFSNFHEGIRGRFFYYYLSANLRFEAFRETAKSTVDSLRRPMLANIPIVMPPVDEQDRIVEVIDSEARRIDAVLEATRREIDLMREYRTRLIADVVTGKLDVREAAEQLPDEVEEPEPLDDADTLGQADGSEGEEDLDAVAEEVVA